MIQYCTVSYLVVRMVIFTGFWGRMLQFNPLHLHISIGDILDLNLFIHIANPILHVYFQLQKLFMTRSKGIF